MINFVLCCILVHKRVLFVVLYRWCVAIFTYSGEVYRLLLEPEDINTDIILVNYYGYATNRFTHSPQMHIAAVAVPMMTLNISSFTYIVYLFCVFFLTVWRPVSHYNSSPLFLPTPSLSMLRKITTHKSVHIIIHTNICPVLLTFCVE
jgi:hypothetical protein